MIWKSQKTKIFGRTLSKKSAVSKEKCVKFGEKFGPHRKNGIRPVTVSTYLDGFEVKESLEYGLLKLK